MNAPRSLKEIVETAIRRHDTSARQLSFLAKDHGFRIVDTTINQIRNGTYKSIPSQDTLRALAWLAGVPEEIAFTAAGQPAPGPPLADELPPGADNLSPKSRKAVLDMMRVLIDLESGQAHDASNQDSPPTDLDAVRERRHGQTLGIGQKSAGEETFTPPSADQLAAHPYFELHADRVDLEFETLGEESQDFGEHNET